MHLLQNGTIGFDPQPFLSLDPYPLLPQDSVHGRIVVLNMIMVEEPFCDNQLIAIINPLSKWVDNVSGNGCAVFEVATVCCLLLRQWWFLKLFRVAHLGPESNHSFYHRTGVANSLTHSLFLVGIHIMGIQMSEGRLNHYLLDPCHAFVLGQGMLKGGARNTRTLSTLNLAPY